MALPDSRSRTYNGNSQIVHDDLNDLQDSVVNLWRAVRGNDLLVMDDFLGGKGVGFAPDDRENFIFTDSTPVAVGADDLANGGWGTCRLAPTAAHQSASFVSCKVPIGSADFRIATRVRVDTLAHG